MTYEHFVKMKFESPRRRSPFDPFMPCPGLLPDSSAGKESTCNAGDPVQSMHWEDPLEKGMATHPSILAWEIPLTEEPGSHSPWGHKELDRTE